jgi:NAD(P)-dependent dehydrogenase (short-subunit alcohol dehydrogenase family)
MILKDKTAVITGSSGHGMGRSIALALAREGANVVINYRKSKDEAEKIVQYVNNNYSKAYAVKADIFEQKDCDFLIEETISAFKGIDILVIGPGAGWNMEPIDKLKAENSLNDVDKEIAPIYYFLPKVLPFMYRQKWGRIIGISLLMNPPSPSYSYNVAKNARTNALLAGVKAAWDNNVTINVISPGPVGHVKQFDKAIDLNNKKEDWTNRKNITPQDISESVVFLCSENADFITGTEINFRWK